MAEFDKQKEKKYDRQLRLWGIEGQKRLEATHICVLNGGCSATETLKNLVLPGIGKFTVIDDKMVANRDLGNNFFLELGSLGKPRADEACRLLHELNDFCLGSFPIKQNPIELVNTAPDFVKDYSIIVATELPETSVVKLAAACEKHNKPLVVVRLNGLVGYVRLSTTEHTIVESKPQFPPVDLRLNAPFPALEKYAASVPFNPQESMAYSHIPYPVTLVMEMKKWKDSHGGKAPQTDPEQDAFKAQIRALQTHQDQANWVEAVKNAHHAYNSYTIPSEIDAILNDPKAKNPLPEYDNFWFLAAAVKAFVDHKDEGNGKLPLMGTIPDMIAETKVFVDLQRIYRTKAAEDIAAVQRHLNNILAKAGVPLDRVTEDEVKNFCKHTLFLKVLRYNTISSELSGHVDKENLGMFLENFVTGGPGDGCWYLALRAAEKFRAEHNRYPGENTQTPHDDFESLRKHADQLITSIGFDPDQLPNDHLQELCRYGNSQIHNLAAVMGGVAAQEIIKLVTHQWVPLGNTFVFNGVNATSASLKV